MENADVTGGKEVSLEDTNAAYRTEKGRELWLHVANFINKPVWPPSLHRTLGREGRLPKESTEKVSGLPDCT